MRIPLPRMLRQLRQDAFASGGGPKAIRAGLAAWAFVAARPWLYRLATGVGVRILGLLGRRHGRFRRLPGASGWTAVRDLPAPAGRTFQALWTERNGARQ